MDVLEVIAAKRTGQHAIISWIVRNLTDKVLTLQNNLGVIKLEYVNDRLLYWNDGNNNQPFGLKLFKETGWSENLENLIINYEDVTQHYSFFSKNEIYRGSLSYDRFDDIKVKHGKRLVILRNFYNCLASRYKQNISGEHPHPYDQKFIDIWKDNAKFVINNPKQSLKYEDWLNNPQKRKEILFDFFSINERYSPEMISGRSSSFEKSNYNNRIDEVNLPQEIKDLIRNDNELHYLMGTLGYQYKEI